MPAPPAPRTLREAGLESGRLADLVLKLLYLHGTLPGYDIAHELRLPFALVDECLKFLKEQRCAEVTGGDAMGQLSQRFVLTDLGRIRARDVFEQCRYVGPAPVPLSAYVEQCRLQSLVDLGCDARALKAAFEGLVLPPHLLDEIGPALCSGRSLCLFGPPGNGKTQIARRLGEYLHRHGGEIYVPYALDIDGAIVTVFDPANHQALDSESPQKVDRGAGAVGTVPPVLEEPLTDRRWRRIRRPVLVAGGELTLDMLELRFTPGSGYYTAPLQIKANGGVLLIDDFGRQLVDPRELLNRWILPLEERVDFLTLATGRKVAVPFELLTMFSTNLDPQKLLDEGFLRRIRHKVYVGPPTREMLAEILSRECERRALPLDPGAVDYLFAEFYGDSRSPRCSDPRDLVEIAASLCRFRGERPRLDRSVLAEAARRLFCSA